MAANLGPVPPGWHRITRGKLEAHLVTTPHSQVRHMQISRVNNIEDYLFIGGPDLPTRVAAERLGVKESTIWTFRSILHKVLS